MFYFILYSFCVTYRTKTNGDFKTEKRMTFLFLFIHFGGIKFLSIHQYQFVEILLSALR